jgi:hypothetical protein
MRHRIQTRRKPKDPIPASTAEQGHSKLQPRPFPVDAGTGEPPTQAQQERIARPTPGLMDIPLYPLANSGGAATSSGGNAVQMQAENEANLKPPQGTLQRQQVDEKQRQEQLNLKPQTAEAMSEDEDMMQRQPATDKDEEETAKAIQAKEVEQDRQLQAKEDAELEQEKTDEEIQTKEVEKEALKAKLEQKRSQPTA